MAYTTSDIKTIFNIAPETVRNWAKEFERYLSVSANPQQGRTRLFTEDDLKVFDLVNSMREDSKSYDEIHATLASGERGSYPALSPEDVKALVTGETERQLSLEIMMLRRQLQNANDKIVQYDSLKEENVRLQAEKDAEKRRVDELGKQLKDTQDKLEGLLREVGKAYHDGYIAALKEQLKKDE